MSSKNLNEFDFSNRSIIFLYINHIAKRCFTSEQLKQLQPIDKMSDYYSLIYFNLLNLRINLMNCVMVLNGNW